MYKQYALVSAIQFQTHTIYNPKKPQVRIKSKNASSAAFLGNHQMQSAASSQLLDNA